MKRMVNKVVFPKKIAISLFVLFTIIICLAVFVKSFLIKDTYIEAELLVSGGEWWWDTIHPPYWLGDPIVTGAAEYTIQGKKQVELLDVQKFNEGSRKIVYIKARLLATVNKWTKKYRYKQNPLEVGATLLLSPNNIQLYANVIGLQGITPERDHIKRTVTLKWYNVYPWQADAISVGDQMISSEKDVWATILTKEVTNAEKIILNTNPQNPQGNVVIGTTDPLKRDVTLTAEIQTTLATSSEVFAYYLPVKIGDMLIINLPKIIITPLLINIQ
jgi:hypothetical protein